MVKDLIINVAILISFISIASHIMKEKEIGSSAPARIKIITGITSGVLGILLIIFGFHPSPSTIIDFRNIVLTMAATFGGVISLLLCGLLIAVFRVTYYGLSVTTIAAVITTAVICIGDIIILRQKFKTVIRWSACSIFNTIIISLNLSYVLNSKEDLPELLAVYMVFSALVSLLVYNYVNYSLTANKLYRKLKKESTKDFLTGLNNVRSFDMLFNEVVKSSKDKNEPLSLLMIDIDFFKKVNDTYGHQQGDLVLQELGTILLKSSRSFDIVSRNGGEEFTVLLLDCDLEHAVVIAERIRAAVQAFEFVLSNKIKIKITISIGVASLPESTNNEEHLLELADSALYKAKKSGRNKVCTTKEI